MCSFLHNKSIQNDLQQSKKDQQLSFDCFYNAFNLLKYLFMYCSLEQYMQLLTVSCLSCSALFCFLVYYVCCSLLLQAATYNWPYKDE